MPALSTRSRPSPPRGGTVVRLLDSDLVAVIVCAVVALAVSSVAIRPPQRVPELVVSNDTSYDTSLAVRGESGGSVVLSTVERGSERAFVDVPDRGDSWVFAVQSQGVDAGEFSVTRDELEASGWRISIPDEVEAELRAAGVPPSP